jgi:ABC-2 type transport system ATP-binding protein
MLDRMGLPASREPSSHLSVGNQQRLNLAIGLLGEPDVLLLDEPTASLDREHRSMLFAEIEKLRERGGSVLFATHVLEEVTRLADVVIVLSEGRIAFRGRPHELPAETPEVVGA